MVVMGEQTGLLINYKQLMRDPNYKGNGALPQRMNLDVLPMESAAA